MCRSNEEKMNDMSFVSLHLCLTVLADRVSNFKRMNVKLLTFKLSKFGSK